ncbi:ABC transporter permease [Chelativorans sp. AA-79]|uniref:ABC transporter permease n=1 Tax=Chelativorans sp. AA-79 TaxID=3028735 RepID=UPI0023F91C3E|nr:ABC transporter permease [Chelativorans sp. AA-79]WEX08032.1 ABC transporter permease [Chelativorans sp. AA-79]
MNLRSMPALSSREVTLAAACLAAILIFWLVSPHFGTVANLSTILRNSVELLLIGLGMTLLLAMGGIDVSVGVAMGLAAIAVGQVLAGNGPTAAAALAGPLTGAALGIITASVVVLGRIPPIVATLGLFGVFRTAIFLWLGGQWLSGLPTDLTALVSTHILGVPLTAWIIAAAYLATWFALRRTPFGPHLLAIGNSEAKARLSGISVRKVQFSAFVISGALCGLAATFYVATYRNVEMTIGSTLALEAIAAVVLGGTSILGGRCSLVGTVLGVLLIRILQNGLLLVGVPSLWQTVVTGGLLLAVLCLDAFSGRLSLPVPGRRPA